MLRRWCALLVLATLLFTSGCCCRKCYFRHHMRPAMYFGPPPAVPVGCPCPPLPPCGCAPVPPF